MSSSFIVLSSLVICRPAVDLCYSLKPCCTYHVKENLSSATSSAAIHYHQTYVLTAQMALNILLEPWQEIDTECYAGSIQQINLGHRIPHSFSITFLTVP